MSSTSLDQSMDLFDDDNEERNSPSPPADLNVAGPKNGSCGRESKDHVKALECPFCNEYKSNEYRLQCHIESCHPDGNVYNNKEQAKIPSSKDSLSSDRKTMNGFPDDINTFVCPYCDNSHESKQNLAQHLTEFHRNDVDYKDIEELIRSLDLLLCPLCSTYICSSEADMLRHVEVQHSTPGKSSRSHSRGADLSDTRGSLVQVCPVCGLEEVDPDLLNTHIEFHFETPCDFDQDPSLPSTSKKKDIKRSSSSSSSVSASSSSSEFKDKRKGSQADYKQQYRKGLEKAVMKGKLSPGDYYDKIAKMKENDMSGKDDGHSKVEGLIEKLASFYNSRSREGQWIALCQPTDYYCGSYGDKGWGCGYRNLQMMLSCLSRIGLYSRNLFPDGKIEIPSVPKIQEMIEMAWQKGFDREGSQQLKGKVVNTRKWIGATEIVATLSSLGIRCQLVDFPLTSSPDGTHPRLLQWVRDYFYIGDRETKPPLYLQHQGHSRTIIGVEEEKEIIRLLLFDPSSSVEQISSLRSDLFRWKQLGSFRRNLAGFRAKQYQIVSVSGLMNREETERSKRLTSIRVL